MDREIRAQERHHQSEAKRQREAAIAAELQKHAVQVHTQLSQLHRHLPGSPRELSDRSSETRSGRSSHLDYKDRLDKIEALATSTTPSTSSAVYSIDVLRFVSFIP